ELRAAVAKLAGAARGNPGGAQALAVAGALVCPSVRRSDSKGGVEDGSFTTRLDEIGSASAISRIHVLTPNMEAEPNGFSDRRTRRGRDREGEVDLISEPQSTASESKNGVRSRACEHVPSSAELPGSKLRRRSRPSSVASRKESFGRQTVFTLPASH